MFGSARGFRRADDDPAGTDFLGSAPTPRPASHHRSSSTTKKNPYITLSELPERQDGKYSSSEEEGDMGLSSKQHTPHTHHRTFSAQLHAPVEPHISELMDKRQGELAQWGIHWYTPLSMAALYLAGCIAAFAHHAYYSSLHLTPAHDQLMKVRYGTALAFFTKACLVGSVVVAYKQRIWYTMRRKALSLRAVDALFGVVEDPSLFLNREVWGGAKGAMMMAVATWLIPIAAVLSPASLTSTTWTRHATLPLTVPTLSFAQENLANYRHQSSFPGYQLTFVNTSKYRHPKLDFDEFDWYDQPSKVADRIVTLSILSQGAVLEKGNKPCKANCTYLIEFEAPTFKCERYDETELETKPLPESAPKSMQNWTELVPTGDTLYHSEVDIDDYLSPQIDLNSTETPPGTFKTEPDIWIGFAVNKTTERDPSAPRFKEWHHDFSRHVVHCQHYTAMLTVNVSIWNGAEKYTVVNRTYLAPLLAPTPGAISRFDTPMYPTFENYNHFIAYHALAVRLRAYLKGKITQKGCDFPAVTSSDINKTILINQSNSQPIPHLGTSIQAVYENITLSLLSEPRLVIAKKQNLQVHTSEILFVFYYSPRALWAGYAVVMIVALLFLAVGAHALYSNGVSSDTTFSRVVVTTRNRTIDRLAVGACLGGDPFPRELEKVKLRFGVLAGTAPAEYAASETSMASRTPLLKSGRGRKSEREAWGSPLTSPPLSGGGLLSPASVGGRFRSEVRESGDLTSPGSTGHRSPRSPRRRPVPTPLQQVGYFDAGSRTSPPAGLGISNTDDPAYADVEGEAWRGDVEGGGGLRTIGAMEGRGAGHCAFGTVAETYLIRRGGVYQ